MKVRLGVLKDKKPKEYKLSKKYLKFLSLRTKLNDEERFAKANFIIDNNSDLVFLKKQIHDFLKNHEMI